MCVPGLDPVTAAIITAGSAAASGAGAMMNADTQAQAMAAQNEQNKRAAEMAQAARDAEAQRQLAFEQQQTDRIASALMEANPERALSEAQKKATAPSNPVVEAGSTYTAADDPSPFQNRTIDKQSAGKVAETDARTAKIVQALAQLSALNTGMQGISNQVAQSGSDIATTATKRRGSLNANALETSIPAGEVTAGDSMLGDLLLVGGQAGATIGGQSLGASGTTLGELIAGKRGPAPVKRPIYSSGGLY